MNLILTQLIFITSCLAISFLPNDIIQLISDTVTLDTLPHLANVNKHFHNTTLARLSTSINHFKHLNSICGFNLSHALHPSIGLFTQTLPYLLDLDDLLDECIERLPGPIEPFPHITHLKLTNITYARINLLQKFKVYKLILSVPLNPNTTLVMFLLKMLEQGRFTDIILDESSLMFPFPVQLQTINSLSLPTNTSYSQSNIYAALLNHLESGILDTNLDLESSSYTSLTLPL